MAKEFLLEIVTAEEMVLSVQALEVVVSTIEGELTILANHAPLISRLIPGKIKIKTSEARDVYVTYGGFLQIKDNVASLLLEHVIHLDSLDSTELDERIAQARLALQESSTHHEKNEHEDLLHQLSSLKHSL